MKSLQAMLPSPRVLAGITATLIIMGGALPLTVHAQQEQFCGADDYSERASEILREVELSEFGIVVSIPENYRTMKLQDGSVKILHPSDFEMLTCLARGGQGGHGYYSETISLVDDNLSMDLREQALWSGGYSENRDGSREPSATTVIAYEENGLNGYIVPSMERYSVHYLGILPGSDSLLKVSAGCDCEVDVASVTDLLSRMSLL